MDINPERFALAELVEDLRGVFGPLTEEKQLRFTIGTAPGVPAYLVTDKQRLRQILYNLLSNAVKFTDHGQVELRIDTTGPRVMFSVADTGIGISRDNLPSIFSAFQQADGTTSRRYGGTGLGLAICREVANQLGGEVTVESELGAGSTFRLHLPLAAQTATAHAKPGGVDVQAGTGGSPANTAPATAAPATAIRPVPPATQHGILRGHKVLIVDDDPRNAFVLTDVLEMHGMIVVQATDGRKAITELAAGDIDLVLMDVMMPRMDGYETTRAIRRMPEFARLPVITVTARAMQGDREKSIAAGASDYITKPIDIEELLHRMEHWLAPDADYRS
jgi:CheY-like chemotaxis protein